MIRRLPITTTIVYLAVGIVLGPWGTNVLRIDAGTDLPWLHHGAELAVLLSLFTVGMKLRVPPRDALLRPALGLASVSMLLTVGLVALVGFFGMGLPIGAAVLLGAVLAPTDPVLASDVQLRHPTDRDRVRLTLSVEAGLNDGTAFPFVMLGLGLMHLDQLGSGLHWLLADVLWAGLGGLAIGALLGYAIGRLVLSLHQRRQRAVAFGEYLVIGLIGVSYGIAVKLQTYGFLAVFAAGMALRAVERRASDGELPQAAPAAGSAAAAVTPARLAGTLLSTNEQLEHILEVLLVVLVGAAIGTVGVSPDLWWFAPLLFFVLRPVACIPVLVASGFSRFETLAISWFGIRGIGSLFYVMYAVSQGLSAELSHRLASLTLSTIALSILAHGISVTPLFDVYGRRRGQRRPAAAADDTGA